MSNFGITLKTIKVYGDEKQKVDDVYPIGTRRIVEKLCLFPPKIKQVVQTCTIITKGSVGHNKWSDIKVKKTKN